MNKKGYISNMYIILGALILLGLFFLIFGLVSGRIGIAENLLNLKMIGIGG